MTNQIYFCNFSIDIVNYHPLFLLISAFGIDDDDDTTGDQAAKPGDATLKAVQLANTKPKAPSAFAGR